MRALYIERSKRTKGETVETKLVNKSCPQHIKPKTDSNEV